MEKLLGTKNFPYFSDAITDLLWGRYQVFQIVCAVVALLHVLCERLYLGKSPEKLWLGLLIALFVITVSETAIVEKKLTQLNTRRYATNLRAEERQAAAEDFQTWRGVLHVINIFAIGGLGIYLWRMGNPADPTRFVSANKFRS